jgi:hypothetical protein
MAKLAAGTGLKLPEIATQALNQSAMMSGGQATSVASVAAAAHSAMQQQQQQLASMNPPIATQCFLLSNMFDPATESSPNWDLEIRDDVIDECSRHGGVLHIYVDKMAPQGNVYVKCNSIASAVASVNALHGRWFAGEKSVKKCTDNRPEVTVGGCMLCLKWSQSFPAIFSTYIWAKCRLLHLFSASINAPKYRQQMPVV